MALALELKSTGELVATLSATDAGQDLSFGVLKARLDEAGYGKYDIPNKTLSDLALKAQNKQAGEFIIGKKPEYTDIQFSLDKETGDLYATLVASEEEILVSRASLMDELKALNFDKFFYEPNALDKLYNQINKNERGSFIIGQRKDAGVHIECDDELMHAYITISPPQGGRELDQTLLDKGLADQGIYRECCDEEVLQKVLREQSADHVEFAHGSEPIDGADAKFEALVEEVVYSTPKESKTGQIDLREIVSFTIIEEGTNVMRRIPAVLGINGRNVRGQVIPAVEGEDYPFDEDLDGVTTSDEDSNVLVSTCKGHPVILPFGVKVDNTIEVNNVDMSTGNLTYDGSVLVKGEVKAGMKIRVTGDIIVKGVVTKATLQAKHNIKVECGVIGSDPAKDGEESPPAILKAGGNIEAQYINLTEIHCGHDVNVKEYMSHCTTEAKHQVLAGQGSGKGRIFGGTCYAQSGIIAKSIGASGGIKTHVSAGTPPSQMKQFEQLIKNHDNRLTQAKQLNALQKKYRTMLEENPQEIAAAQKVTAIQKVLGNLNEEISKMEETISKINRLFKESKNAQITIQKETYPNVEISINGAEFHIRQESKGGVFIKQGDDIRWKNLNEK